MRIILFIIGLLICVSSIFAVEPPPVRVVYFVPTDRTPCKDYENRVDKMLRNVQEFYREGMEKNGFGPMSFSLERDEDGKLKIYMVDAKGPMDDYGRNSSSKVRNEVASVMRDKYGIDVNRETIIIFQLLLKVDDDGKATEIGPYVGGGSSLSGTAWVYDDERLDPDLLVSKAPGGYYHRPVSLGKFNTTYVGGLAHELGHAFSLPHDCEKDSEKPNGRSLMGSGNHTYGENLRDEGNGTFLSAASAYRLRYIRSFAGDLPDARANVTWSLSDMKYTFEDGKLNIEGKVSASPPISSVIAYNDFGGIAGDYDAVTWVCPIEDMKAGDTVPFKISVSQLKPGDWQLRLFGTHTNGKTSRMSLDYKVGDDGKPNLAKIALEPLFKELAAAYFAGDFAKMDELLCDCSFPADDEDVMKKMNVILKLRNPDRPLAPITISPSAKKIEVSKLKFTNARTGWGAIRRDHVPEDLFLESNGKIYESGLYAHAPSVYELDIENSGWMKFTTGYGLRDGRAGSVVFVVRGDGKELFRSEKIERPNQTAEKEIDITGVKKLELLVEDAGDGNGSDWGLWLNPALER